jgi:hypothetical protein
MTKELRKELLWWWENRPVKGATNVFLCLDDTEFCREYYGKPFLKRLQFMRRLCDRAGVKRFGFHGIRHLTATTLYKLGKRQINPIFTSRARRVMVLCEVKRSFSPSQERPCHKKTTLVSSYSSKNASTGRLASPTGSPVG